MNKDQLTQHDIMLLVDISSVTFWRMRKDGIIPPPDDTKRTPYVWNANNPKLVEFLNSRKSKA